MAKRVSYQRPEFQRIVGDGVARVEHEQRPLLCSPKMNVLLVPSVIAAILTVLSL